MHKFLVLVKMKFVPKVFSEVWYRTEVASNRCLPFAVRCCWGLTRLIKFECLSYAVYSKAQACCMSDIASHHFSSVRCTNLLYFEKKKKQTVGLTNGQKIGNRHRVGVGYRNGYRRVAVTLQRELIIL